MTAVTDTAARAVIVADAEAIEHAMHVGRLSLADLGTPLEVAATVAEVRAAALGMPGGLAALCAADYCDDPELFCRRMREALYRAAELNGVDDHQLAALYRIETAGVTR